MLDENEQLFGNLIPEDQQGLTDDQIENEFYSGDLPDTLKLWNKVRSVPQAALSVIKGKRYQGTSIKPIWRIYQLTKMFGEYGKGWKVENIKREIVTGAQGAVFIIIDILLYVKSGNEWLAPSPGTGTAFLVSKETERLYNDDDALKKAFTTALAQASKLFGIGADVYFGHPNEEYMEKYINSYDDLPDHIHELARKAKVSTSDNLLDHQRFLEYCIKVRWNIDYIRSALLQKIQEKGE